MESFLRFGQNRPIGNFDDSLISTFNSSRFFLLTSKNFMKTSNLGCLLGNPKIRKDGKVACCNSNSKKSILQVEITSSCKFLNKAINDNDTSPS